MTHAAPVWTVRDRNVQGALDSDGTTTIPVSWGFDEELPIEFPWSDLAHYPSLLIMGLMFRVFTSAVAGTRRPVVTVSNGVPTGAAGVTRVIAGNGTTAGLNREYYFAVGTAMPPAALIDRFKEPLPVGLILHPGLLTGGNGLLNITIDGVQAGDSLGDALLFGYLLLA